MIKRFFTLTILFLALAPFAAVARAQETVISITGNGASSQNTVEVHTVSSTTVQQSNDAQVTNNVNNNSNTGNNQTNSNSGASDIQTGSISSTANVNNQNINSNVSENKGCGCVGNTTTQITGNGTNSVNNINLDSSQTTNINQVNNAIIVNTAEIHANTGENSASLNSGDVQIKTGNISDTVTIKNKNINQNIDPQDGQSGLFMVKIKDNGDGSENNVRIALSNIFDYQSKNLAILINTDIEDPNTGGNTADSNIGGVLITTGDIVKITTIGNENINGSFFNPPPSQIIPPPGGGGNPPPIGGETPPAGGGQPSSSSNSSGGGSSVGGVGQVLGAAAGAVLPATGSFWMLLMMLLSITMFIAGWYLRFGSDPSPPAYAFA
ncbi:hypothetical protein M1146_00740 [Patescibacteria group bacterium]|nr:hypothetical protein [Patescibacteria group bacterium]